MTTSPSTPTPPLTELTFTVSGRIDRSSAETYEAVADPAQLSQYFTTAGARGRLETGAEVEWDFADFPGAFPVKVVEDEPGRRIVIEWDAAEQTTDSGYTRVTFEFAPLDDDTRTLVTITESSWHASPEGAKAAFGNCEGWTGMLCAMKVWVEHRINLREGFYR